MSNLSDNFLKDLKKTRFPGLDFPPDFILPAYQGQSLLNIPSSICDLLGAEHIHSLPLRPEILSPLNGNIQRIILILMDALSLLRFSRWLDAGTLPVWGHLLKSGNLFPITSISPSTTSTAMTTLWTGRSTVEHGVGGYELWLKEYGLVANMVLHAPMSFHSSNPSLEMAGFDPESMLTIPTLGEHLGQHGVSTHAFQHYSIAHSGLSRTFMKNVGIHPFGTEAECWVNVRELIDKEKKSKLYIWTYWGSYDSLSHRYSPEDERSLLYFQNFSRTLEENLINRMSPSRRQGTLLVLTADHGQVVTRKDPHYELSNHPAFMDCLHIRPTGESRMTYLHVKPGKESVLRDYIEQTWPDQFLVMKSQDLVENGLFGPGTPLKNIQDRLGYLTVMAKGNHYFWWADEPNPLLGRHGGLSPDEMLVPFLAVHL